MKVYSKFDSSLLGEAEGVKPEKDPGEGRIVNPMKVARAILENLRTLRNNQDMLAIYSSETGKTVDACRRELDSSILHLEIGGLRKISDIFGERSVNSRSFSRDAFTFLDEGMPVFSLVAQMISNMARGKAQMIVHCENAPLTTMYLTEGISERYEQVGSMLFDLLPDVFENKGKLPEWTGEITVWGSERRIDAMPFHVMNSGFRARLTSNFPVLIRNYSGISPAVDRVMEMSFNSISNAGMRGQIYMVPDKDFVFFRNRIIETVKRMADDHYGAESSVNYFPSKEHSDRTRQKVADLLKVGWDYIDELPETVHILTDQYGDIQEGIELLDGPVIQVMHYSSLMDCAKRIEKMNFGDRLDFYGDSMNDYDFLKEYFGSRRKVISGKSMNEMMPDFIL